MMDPSDEDKDQNEHEQEEEEDDDPDEDDDEDEEEEEEEEDEEEEEQTEEENTDENADDDEFCDPPEDFEHIQLSETGQESNDDSVLIDGQNIPIAAALDRNTSQDLPTRKGHVSKMAAQFSDADSSMTQGHVSKMAAQFSDADSSMTQENTKHESCGESYKPNEDDSYNTDNRLSKTEGYQHDQSWQSSRGRSRGRGRNKSGSRGHHGRGGRGYHERKPDHSPNTQTPKRPRMNPNNPRGGSAERHGYKHHQEWDNVETYNTRSGSPYGHNRDDRIPPQGRPQGYVDYGRGDYSRQGEFYEDENYDLNRNDNYHNNHSNRGRTRGQRHQYYQDTSQYRQNKEDEIDYESSEYRSHQYGQKSRDDVRIRPRGRTNYSNRGSRGQPPARRGRQNDPRDYERHWTRHDHTSRPDTYTSDDKGYDSRIEIEPVILAVSGFDTSIDQEMLSMYFESPRKSGGGEIEEYEMSPSGCSALIKFKEAAVTERVLQRSHTLQGKRLRVEEQKHIDTRGAEATSQDQAETKSPVIEVSGFDSSMSEDMLTLYFENERKSGGGEILSFKFNRTRSTATITFAEMSVTERVLQRSHTLQGKRLRVEEQKHIDTRGAEATSQDQAETKSPVIEVSGFDSSMSEDMLTLYFENERKSGGGEILSFKFNRTRTTATITFAEMSVTERVLQRSHTLQGKRLRVEEQKHIDTRGAVATSQDQAETKSPVIEVSGFDSSMSEDMLTLYFENERKSGGGEILSFKFNRTRTTATITFAEMSVIERVLKKSHSFAGQALTVAEKKEEQIDPVSTIDETVSTARVLEVSGFEQSTSDEMLMMYFENKRRSGGGDIESIEMNQKKNRATITFADESVIDRVLRKSHKLSGVTLTVNEKKAQPPRPIDKHRLFLKGIPEDVTQDTLMMFIENRTNIDDEPQIVYGEQPGTVMLCYDEEIQDMDSIINKFGKRKLKKFAKVSAEQVKATDGILVQGLKPGTARDMVELYFENQRKSGGGPVSDVEFNEEENIAFVTFEDWTTVNRVTPRTHSLSGQRLIVTAHYECLGTVVSTEGPVPIVPKPFQHPVNQEIMKHIMEKRKSLIAEELTSCYAEVSWPCDGDRSKVLIKPQSNGSEDRSAWKEWKPNATSQLASFLEKFEADSILVPPHIWTDLSDSLSALELRNVDVEEKGNKSTLTVIGMALDVSKAKGIISKAIEELKIKAEREANTVEKTMKLGTLKTKIFTMFAIKDDLVKQFPDVQIDIKDNKNEVVFKGVRGEVSETVVAMYQVFETLGSSTFKADQNITEFVSKFCDEVNGILTSQRVDAICVVEEGNITVYGRNRSDTDRAQSILRKDIISKPMPIRSDSKMKALQSKKGTDTINNLNDSGEVIIRLDSSNRQIVVTGLSEKVDDATINIGEFLDKNVIIEMLIPLSPSQINFALQKCGNELSDMRNKYPDVTMLPEVKGKKTGFMVKGNEDGITGVTRMFETLKSKLIERKHIVDKPGMPELLRDPKGQRFLKSVANEFDCLINTEKEVETDDEVGVSGTTGVSQTLCHVTTAKGYRLMVCHGDLTKESVDAIVNAANSKLMHIGGLAKAIAVAGGPAIQEESISIMKKKRRNLNTSEAVSTNAGRLPCKYVIHVVGPIWRKGRREDAAGQEEDLLYDAVTNSLREAHDKKLTSIAIPAISTGNYGFPNKLCAETVVEATVDFMAKSKTSLKEIRFTNIAKEQSMAFQNALKDKFGKDVIVGSTTEKRSDTLFPMAIPEPEPRLVAIARPAKPAANITKFTKKSSDTLTTKEGKNVTLKKGSLANETADAIVNTTAGEMDLNRGNVSKALLTTAGPGLQLECDAQVLQSDGTRRSVVAGDFIETGPANLKCKKVYHSHCPSFSEQDAAKVLQSMIKKILVQANTGGMASIAIPAIGTGNLGFPRDVTARVMYEAVAEFSKENVTSTLIDIRFWVYDKDIPTIQAFETEMQQRIAPITPIPKSASDTSISKKKKSKRKMKKSASTTSMSIPEPPGVEEPIIEEPVMVSHPVDVASSSTSETKFGSVTVKLQQGDLSQEDTDAIVNTVGKDLSLKGVVSKALIRTGGKVIADVCDNIRSAASKTVPDITKTTAGKLPSKYIIHAYLSSHDKVKKITYDILKLAEKEGMKSVSFPALGTGNIGGSPLQVAPELIDAIGEFAANEKPKCLQLVKLVIFQRDMVPVFEETLKSKAGASFKKSEGAFKRMLGTVYKYAIGSSGGKKYDAEHKTKKREPKEEKNILILVIIGRDAKKIDQAVKRIEEHIQDEYSFEEVKLEFEEGDESVLTAGMMRSINDIAKKHKVVISPLPGKKGVKVEGQKAAVLGTKADIIAQFARSQAVEKRKAKELLLSKEVQWRFKSDTGIYDDYDEETNALLEKAYQNKEHSLDLEMEDGEIQIDLDRMVEIDPTGNRPEVQINRADLSAETTTSSLPSNWIPMDKNLLVVKLNQGGSEYNEVEQSFKAGYPNANIVQIERIQNKEIFTQYTARKEQMKSRLGKETERVLYHGTSQDTVDKINARGFNRSYCGKNAVMFGQGTYFARDISYSAQNQYSRPDAKNQKYIYICKVLVGDAEKGDRSMVMPSQKPGSIDIYDSTVNDVADPQIVVIYHDAQAYPEYLVKFT